MTLSTNAYLIVDAGGTFLKSAVLNCQGEVYPGSGMSVNSFSDAPKEDILRSFREIITMGMAFIKKHAMIISGLGLAFPGPFDFLKATSLMKHKFQSIYGFNLREYFYQLPGMPDNVPVRFIHDANAVLAGELWKGNAAGFENVAVVTLGTGLGFAISEHGKILRNHLGSPGIAIYNLPYRDGILEDYVAKRGFIKTYCELRGKSASNDISVSEIGEMADNGDSISIQTFNEVGKILAESLQNILYEKNIQCLLFSGQISKSFSHMETALKDGLRMVNSLQRIAVVKSIDNAALLGALSNVVADL